MDAVSHVPEAYGRALSLFLTADTFVKAIRFVGTDCWTSATFAVWGLIADGAGEVDSPLWQDVIDGYTAYGQGSVSQSATDYSVAATLMAPRVGMDDGVGFLFDAAEGYEFTDLMVDLENE